MDATALLLSRLQFAFTISFHIIFPSFSIGLAAWLTLLEALCLATGRPAYRMVFEFWLKIFGVAFGLGVVSGIVMAFQFGTNWDVLARMSGPIQGCCFPTKPSQPFFSRPVFLEFSSSDALAFRRGSTCSRRRWWRWAPRFRRSGSWPTTAGCRRPSVMSIEKGEFVPTDWSKIVFSPVLWVRFPHMLLASYITGAFCVAATGAWYLLRGNSTPRRASCCAWVSVLAAVLVPVQLFFGHLNGEYVVHHQPSKMAAIEARWHDEKPASRSCSHGRMRGTSETSSRSRFPRPSAA